MTRVFIISMCAVVVLYGVFEAAQLIIGPQISIASPKDGSATSSGMVAVAGTARSISFLTINDKPAYTDESGNFTELLSLPPGYTVVTVSGVDRFGRRASKSVAITMRNNCPLNG